MPTQCHIATVSVFISELACSLVAQSIRAGKQLSIPVHTDITLEVCIRSFNIPERTSVPKCSVFSGFSVLSVRLNSTSTLMRAQTSMPQFGQARLTALVLLDGKAAPGRRGAGSY